MRYLLVLLIFANAGSAYAEVLSGRIDNLLESTTFCWGDSQHELFTQYSAHDKETDGWFYGRLYSWSNVDIYVYEDPGLNIGEVDATNFPYSPGSELAGEGDTVFFRGVNGLYGAWRIDAVEPSTDTPGRFCTLRGYWFLQTDGTGLFSGSPVVNQERTSWGEVKALYRK